ncbi:MAG: DoxX family protein [Micropepsaceae bacterium]
MTDTPTKSRVWTIALWIAQLMLAAAYGLFGSMKATQPLDQLSQMMTWIPEMQPAFVRGLGVVEVLGAVGLILPALTRIQPQLTVVTALCIVVHQLFAVALHASKGEFNVLALNAVLIVLAAFIFWGRRTKAVIEPRG